ncbi:hypothetical protein ACQEVB_11765 [Pseudonocardia sp. CA-107938]|uniref:hypothetical protein n=1 Tax=Pseudonocardia sp. CA-107938 TaxID=3240021 RepID=UPI003D8B23A6
MLSVLEVRAAMEALGAGDITVGAAAEQVRPAYKYALARPRDTSEVDDISSIPTAFTEVGVALDAGTISLDQYVELTAVLQGSPRSTMSSAGVPDDRLGMPGR